MISRLFVPWNIRTLDRSYHRLFVPWTIRPHTIRTQCRSFVPWAIRVRKILYLNCDSFMMRPLRLGVPDSQLPSLRQGTRLSTIGDRAFPVAAARVWNCLPQHVTSAPSFSTFRSRLKTHLFSRCYPAVKPEK